jgi:hypothetical protein
LPRIAEICTFALLGCKILPRPMAATAGSSEETYLMRRLITVAVALLTMASSALAQDTFNVNTNPPANTNPSDASNCQGTYSAAMEKLREQDLEAQGELRKDVVNCNQDQGCRIAAEKRYQAAHNEVLKGEVDADANRDICSHHANLSSTLAIDAQKPDPCHSQYDQTMNALADEETLAQAQSQKDEIDCQPVNDNGSCRNAASQKYEETHRKVLNGETDADTKRGICSDRQALAQSETSSSPANPGAPQTPEVAPTPSAGLAGGVTKNPPATGPAASNPNNPASASSASNTNNPAPSEKPVGGIAQVPKLAPTTGPAAAPSPRKPLQAGIRKDVPGTSSNPIPQPPPPNNIAKNQPAGTTPGSVGKAISNAGQSGAGGKTTGQVPNGRPTVRGPLRIVREGADWVAKHFPGGEAGAQAAADYSKQLKQPFEDRWTKQPDGGIREVGETLAGHGIGKVAGKLLSAAASKIAESPIGRAILDRFPKFPRLMGGIAKDAGEGEGAANRASRNPGPPQRGPGEGPQQQARNGPPNSGSPKNPPNSGGPNNSANNRGPQQPQPQRPVQNSQPQQQARNGPQSSSGPKSPSSSGDPNNSANNGAPEQRQPQRPAQNNQPQQQARNDPRSQSGAGGIGSKSEKEFIPPRPTIKPTVVSDGFGGYKATWGRDPKAFAMFRPENGGVVVSDLFRGAQPSGSGGIMLADALRKGGLQRPASITFSNIIEDRTLAELKAGMAPGETLLGKTLGNASKDLGARVVGWATGVTNGKPWMKGVLAYE